MTLSLQNNIQLNNNIQLQLPSRPIRSSNAGISVKDIFSNNGGPNHQLYGTTVAGAVNQAYEHVEEEDGNSIRLTPRNQSSSWASNSTSTQRL